MIGRENDDYEFGIMEFYRKWINYNSINNRLNSLYGLIGRGRREWNKERKDMNNLGIEWKVGMELVTEKEKMLRKKQPFKKRWCIDFEFGITWNDFFKIRIIFVKFELLRR